ncbi:MAG: hypothetical protein QOG42_1474 [Solirubrobacteraceae bacterium]|nr:hypothetical protein [Solirubrobacteraceae bacterium]
MVDEPVPIEGIVEGDPEVLATMCAAGGSAIVAYCAAVGAQTGVAETAVAALATFRRGVVDNAHEEPSELEQLLLSATAQAARRMAGIKPSQARLKAGKAALEGAVTEPLPPGFAPRIIRALVDAAPVTALGGDATAVRRAAEEHYIRTFDDRHAQAVPPPAPPPPTPPPAAAPGAWLPPDLLDDRAASSAPALAPDAAWGAPADASPTPAAAAAAAGFEAAPAPPPEDPAAAVAAAPPSPPPGAPPELPGADWRGGPARIWSRLRQRRRSSHGTSSAAGRGRNVLIAGVVGLAVGGGIAAMATPQKTVRPDPVLVRPLDTPFAVDGAVFNVARTGTALWALKIRRRPLQPGHAWLALAAQTRNISRANFHPRGLGYRLRTASGVVIGPDTALVAGEISAVGGRLPVGKRTSVHLGFQVRSAQQGLTLEFDPSPRGPTVRVPLN